MIIKFIHLRKAMAVFICFSLLHVFGFGQNKVKNNTHLQFNNAYQEQLTDWCDALLKIQVQNGADEGGLFCPAHQFVHGRCGDAVYPFLTLFKLTRQEKYRTAARQVFKWSEAHVSQKDGSWTNEANGKNSWQGITCFSTIALGEALRHHGDVLTPNENKEWRERLRKGADFIMVFQTFEIGDINYPVSAAAALALCWKLLGDEKYLLRAKELVNFGTKHFTTHQLIWGEGIRGINDTTPKGLRPIDVPYNIEESLPNLALYGLLTGDKNILDIVKTSLQAHLNFVLPDGALDAGWCSRQFKWTYYGSLTSDGTAGGLALMHKYDKRFSEASKRNLQLRKASTHEGLLHGGPDFFAHNIPICTQHTFTSIKGVATAIDAAIEDKDVGRLQQDKRAKQVILPNDIAYGVREWSEASVIQIGVGDWRASISTNDIASSPKRGGHPMGGALTMLFHKQIGAIAVPSMNDYIRYEGSNMQNELKEAPLSRLTPRLEVNTEGVLYSNLYDTKATLTWFKHGDTIELKVTSHLKDIKGNSLSDAPECQLYYTFTPQSFRLAIESKAVGAQLLFPIVANISETVDQKADGTYVIQKKTGRLQVSSSDTRQWKSSINKRIFNFVPGFEAVPLAIPLNETGYASLQFCISSNK